jgi:2-amino-4-hydroxy-6-hydroxymethyldihydropteridine diphosphokinase
MTTALTTVYVALGSNLDHPAHQIASGFEALARLPHSYLVTRSGLFVTPPWGNAQQPDFINAVARLRTSLSAPNLLAHLLDIERRHGRRRLFRNAPRTLDLDLLLYGDNIIDIPGLTLPHPRMHERPFVLVPLTEIDPTIHIPGHGPARDLLRGLRNNCRMYNPATTPELNCHVPAPVAC